MICRTGCNNKLNDSGLGVGTDQIRPDFFITQNSGSPEEPDIRDLDQSINIDGLRYPVTFTKKQAQNAGIKKGSYRITGRIENQSNKQVKIEDKEIDVQQNGKTYKVKLSKFDVGVPYDSEEGRVSDFEADVKLDQTPINSAVPVAPIIWGASTVAGLGAGYFFVDRLDKFASSATGTLLTIGGLMLAVSTVLKK